MFVPDLCSLVSYEQKRNLNANSREKWGFSIHSLHYSFDLHKRYKHKVQFEGDTEQGGLNGFFLFFRNGTLCFEQSSFQYGWLQAFQIIETNWTKASCFYSLKLIYVCLLIIKLDGSLIKHEAHEREHSIVAYYKIINCLFVWNLQQSLSL